MSRKVSVIIPCYNVEQYVEECVQSVLDQDYPNIEIICVNDGSTDGTLSKLNKIKGIMVIDTKNNGLNPARRNGFNESTGELVVFLDSDDTIPKKAISTMVKYHDSKFDATGFNFRPMYDVFILRSWIKYSLINSFRRLIPVKHSNPMNHNWYMWGKIYNRTFLSRAKWNNVYGMEDKQFFTDNKIKMKMKWKKVLNYRIRSGSIMTKKVDK